MEMDWKWYFTKFFLKAFQGTFVFHFTKYLPSDEVELKHIDYKHNKTKQ